MSRLCFALAIAVVLSMATAQTSTEGTTSEPQKTMDWETFKQQFKKTYTAEEDAKRKQIFEENVKRIEENNKQFDAGEVKHKLKINQFADQTPEEFKKTHTGGLKLPSSNPGS